MISILSIIGVFTLVGVVFVNVSPEFGAGAKDLSLERIRKSPNFLNGTFKNTNKLHKAQVLNGVQFLNFLPMETIKDLLKNYLLKN